MVNLKITSCNTRGLAESVKRKKVFLYNKVNKADVVFFQETHSVKGVEKVWRNTWGGQMYFSHGTNLARGVAIAFQRDLDVKVLDIKRDEEGRFLLLKAEVENEKFLFVNIYAPNVDDVGFFKDLFEMIVQIETDHVICGGDFDVYLDKDLDRKGGVPKLSESALWLNSFMDEWEWIDTWRYLHPDTFQYTWKQRRPFIGSRLDLFLVP